METKELIEKIESSTFENKIKKAALYKQLYTTYDIISKNGKTFKLEITNDNKQKTMKLRCFQAINKPDYIFHKLGWLSVDGKSSNLDESTILNILRMN